MKYCPRCGVVLSESAELCPLCGSASTDCKPESADSGGVSFPSSPRAARNSRADKACEDGRRAASPVEAEAAGPAEEERGYDLSVAERSRVAVELLSVGFGIALAVTLLVDLFVEHGFGWSRYSSVGIVAAWLISAMPLILRGKPWILFAVLAPSLLLLVFLLDVFDGRIGWFLYFGMPITLLLEACVAAAGAIGAALRRKGLNLVAVALTGIAAFCVGLEGILDLNFQKNLAFDWSVVVAFALVPSAGLLFYLHYRIVHRASLRKLFRL
jgi:hypothetical protein